MQTSLTGIKPTAAPHLGNYLGAIRPALALAKGYRSLYFIADYHALTTIRDPQVLRQYTYDVAAGWLACGLDPRKTTIYRQSAVPQVFELSWVLSCMLATGQLERGHAYKDAVTRGETPNAGLFNYPVLMAADILAFDTDVVPVGNDQKQHLELTRDVAQRVNHVFGEGILTVPEAVIAEGPLVPGTDGEKMSKSRGNTIPIFADEKELRKSVGQIVTSSEGLDEPKTPEGTAVFELYCLVASDEQKNEMAQALRQGGYGWGHAKQALQELLIEELGPLQQMYQELRQDEPTLDDILAEGGERARDQASTVLARVRHAVGVTGGSERLSRKRTTVNLREGSVRPPG